MTVTTFIILPAEIQISIAKLCKNDDLINLCLTSRLVKERCLPVLYRHVLLQFNPKGLGIRSYQDLLQKMGDLRKRQQRFVHTVLSHPEYGKQVRSLEGMLCIPRLDDWQDFGAIKISEEDFWRALLSMTVIQCVDISSRFFFNDCVSVLLKQPPTNLFHSATSVRLVGRMQYRLAKLILDGINPATLKHLCLDMVQDRRNGQQDGAFEPGDRGEDGRIVALGVISGLLITLTGRCTALRTLILRRIGHVEDGIGWHTAAEEASYTEWASFIRSVNGTVEKFMFEQAGEDLLRPRRVFGMPYPAWIIMDDAFRRLILPAIVSGKWPCMTHIELGGVGGSMGQDEKTALKTELRAVLGANTEIVVKENARSGHGIRKIFGWS